jgi:hypothetical protein
MEMKELMIRRLIPAERRLAADQSLARPPRRLSLEEARRLAEKGYQACIHEGLPKEYADNYRTFTQSFLENFGQ